MQFYLNGFQAGDPRVAPAAGPARTDSLPPEVDVLIVGCGSTGLTLAAQLAAFPEITTRIVEQNEGPLTFGQADGIACRTMEMFEAFGFVERVMREGYGVNEVSFWKPDDKDPARIVRNGRVQDVEDGVSEFPHVILSQARVHDFYLDVMRNAPTRLEPDYARRLLSLDVAPRGDRPVTVTLERTDDAHRGQIETVRARYVVGCDGVHSKVRDALGHVLKGGGADQAWGVMDVLAVTDFPDIRLKATILSADAGSVLIVPREGGYLVRLYVELDRLDRDDSVAARDVTLDRLIEAAQRVLRPYTLEVKACAWWAVYEAGQSLCESYDNANGAERPPHVFIAGDACHTHSPKAGQGMNVSMQDAFNLGWKLVSVLLGRSPPELLRTYSDERRAIAQDLIDFDREWAAMFSTKPKAAGADPAEVQRYFLRKRRFTAGVETRYRPSALTGGARHQALAEGFEIGARFHSAPAIRLADARRVHLGHALKADGRWRLFLFADRFSPASPSSKTRALCAFLADSDRSPVRRHTPHGADVDSVIDVRAVFQQDHRALNLEETPAFLLPRKGRFGLIDYEKMFCPDLKHRLDIFDMRGIDRESGCIVVVRPDQHVAHVLPLDAHDELADFFSGFMIAPG